MKLSPCMCTRERARRSRWSPAEVQILCRVLVETRPEPTVPCWPVGRRGFAARGVGSRCCCQPVRTEVSRFRGDGVGPRCRVSAGSDKVSGFGDDQLRGKPVGETPPRVKYVARTDYREEARKGRSRSFQMPIKASPSAGTGLRCRHGRATEGVACGAATSAISTLEKAQPES